MRRLPTLIFGALAVATVAAVFITQHLKVTTPLVAGAFGPTPALTIDPTATACAATATIGFHLLHAADQIDLYVVDSHDRDVFTLASGLAAPRSVTNLQFTWHGRLHDGALAPPGHYEFRVRLIHQDRTIFPLLNQTTETPMGVTVKPSC